VDAVNDTAESAKQSVGGALDAAKGATEDVKLSNNQSSKLNAAGCSEAGHDW